jgi:hypothetical protein
MLIRLKFDMNSLQKIGGLAVRGAGGHKTALTAFEPPITDTSAVLTEDEESINS